MTDTMNRMTTDDDTDDERFTVTDLAEAVGVTRNTAYQWVKRRLARGSIPPPLFSLPTPPPSGQLRVWTAEQGSAMVALYREQRRYRQASPATELPNIPATVTFNLNELFRIPDLAKAVGISRGAAYQWVDRRLARGLIPAPLFTLGPVAKRPGRSAARVWSTEQGPGDDRAVPRA